LVTVKQRAVEPMMTQICAGSKGVRLLYGFVLYNFVNQ